MRRPIFSLLVLLLIALATLTVYNPISVTGAPGADAPPPAIQGDPYPHMEGDGYWQEGFNVPNGVDGNVYSIKTTPEGHLVVGGEFTYAEDVRANSLARWDGAAWHSIGEGNQNGVTTVNQFSGTRPGRVYASAYDSIGRLYVAGTFTHAGSVPAKNIAMWDGSRWHALGSGISSVVSFLVITPDDSVVVAGNFGTAGGTRAIGMAVWNGSSWQPLGNSDASYFGIHTLLGAPNGDIYVGGDFTEIAGVPARRLARWDGAAWYPVGGGVNNNLNALAWDSDGNLLAAGSFSEAGGVPVNYIARWDGTTWENLGHQEMGSMTRLAAAPDGTLFVSGWHTVNHQGQFDILRRDSDGWHALNILSSPYGWQLETRIHTLHIAPDGDLRVGHSNTYLGETASYRLGRWKRATQTWHGVGTGIGAGGYALGAIASTADGRLYAGGYIGTAGPTRLDGIAEWRDGAWLPMGRGLQMGIYPGAARKMVAEGSNLYVTGLFYKAGEVVANNVARWDGNQWHALGEGLPGISGAVGIAVREGRLVVAQTGSTIVHYFNGAEWSQLPPSPITLPNALAWLPDGTLYVGGDGLARYVNGAWEVVLPATSGSKIMALAAGADGSLYVGWDYSSVIYRYDGSDWHQIEGVPGNHLNLHMGSDGILYVTGTLTHQDWSHFAVGAWDGEAWHYFGTEDIQPVRSVGAAYYAPHDGGLWVGTTGSSAGGRPSAGIARYALSGIRDFDATHDAPTITLSWSTLNETLITGFNLYRAATPDSTPELLNPAPIPAQHPGTTQGAAYTFTDDELPIGAEGYYWIEVIKSDGEISRYGYIVGAAALSPTPTPTVTATPAQRSLYLPLIRRAAQS